MSRFVEVSVSEPIKPTKVTVSEIFDEKDQFRITKAGKKLNMPYRLRLETEDGLVVSDEPTFPWILPMGGNWKGCFYRSVSKSSGKEYVSFTKDSVLLAVYTIFAKAEKLETKSGSKFDIDSLKGFSFDALVIGKTTPFVNWYETFKLNGVEVPTLEELPQSYAAAQASRIIEKAEAKIDTSDLPF